MTQSISTNAKVWLITGTSSGFGRELAEQLLGAGEKVVATARKTETIADLAETHPDTALVVALDVTKEETIEAALKAALDKFGRVDVLVNNAGYGLAGAVEEATEAEFMPVFETNVFGLIRTTRAFLPQFRKQKSGSIVNLSSIGGLIGSPGWGYYNASKFAVNGFSEALAAEMALLGVHVMIVEPGPFRTEFLGSSGKEAEERIADYDETAGKTRQYFQEQSGKQPGDPVKAVKAIIDAVNAAEPPKHLVLGKLAFDRMQARLEVWKKDLAAWETTSLGADFDKADAAAGQAAYADTRQAGKA
ncbi:oxidoreductase [Granulicella tundricola]|uniref:Short-chain dehydrogenase/reductase SDR n=1 Tax=Granulicella tundricola (strain ATCC BAA-1859 / DSM 23138 / MP5ACTX9) TaxID=1198114 RepID=E8WXH4_GRATM|nr:oxidoreductase [Granulicella tundricola]ADW67507.1 short-chain dehydrogenase/reductase SDR [Granulicella tundricola MP5ACTX9]